MKLTPWFPPNTHPDKSGIYQINFYQDILYAYWNNDIVRWVGFPSVDIEGLDRVAISHISNTQNRMWRGLLE